MSIAKNVLRVIIFLSAVNFIGSANGQNGDQILDGIGETGMVARYLLNGDVKDWSRNNLHGKIHGSDATFINDNRFGKVLSLAGDKNTHIALPAGVLTGLESLSISGWIYLRTAQQDQYFFDFGRDTSKHFFVAPAGMDSHKGFMAAIVSDKSYKGNVVSTIVPTGKWVHLVVVLDIPSGTMTSFVNGRSIAATKDIPRELPEIFGSQSTDNGTFLIGKSIIPGGIGLNALLHDFRIYRVPLSSSQITGIYSNASGDLNKENVNIKPRKADDLSGFAATTPQLYNALLAKVADVTVETQEGVLPRLPSFVKGFYKGNFIGPDVRVIWPADTNNAAVLNADRYIVTGRVPGTNFSPKASVTVKKIIKANTPRNILQAFELNKVVLNNSSDGRPSKFMENRDKFLNALVKTDPNSFLYMFRHAFGQKQPDGAKPLGVWDSQDTKLRGHATGHYLTAIAQAYASTGYDKALQAKFAQKMVEMVDALYELAQLSGKAKEGVSLGVSDPVAISYGPDKSSFDSDLSDDGIRNDYWNWGKGFISAYPPDQFIMLENGAKYGGQKNQIWAPYYTLHKILAGLMDVYEVSGNKKALAVATGMGDWVHARLSKLPQQTLTKMWNTYIAGEYGGMNEAMARLYKITGKDRYLKTAQLFDNVRVFFGDAKHTHGLAKNVDLFRGLHANQHIPQIVGSVEMYNVSHNPEYYKVADNFWHKAVNDYMYSIGGVAGARNPANAECFISQPSTIYENGFSEGGQNETCATYNMLKLTRSLFLLEQRAELMDYYERALYNHILASVAEKSPANTYHVSLRPGSIKQFSNPDMSGFTCCNGTAIESSTKLQNSIYFRSEDNKALYVNLYVPSTLDWSERKVTIEQITNFPKEGSTKLLIKGNGDFDLHLRVPGWATGGFFVKINGIQQKVSSRPGSYLKLTRNWKNDDTIELTIPFQFHLDPVTDQPNIASLFYGPVLLAAQEPAARKDWRKVTLNARDIGKTIKGDPKQLQFTIGGIEFKPFYYTYGRYSVYLDVTLE